MFGRPSETSRAYSRTRSPSAGRIDSDAAVFEQGRTNLVLARGNRKATTPDLAVQVLGGSPSGLSPFYL
jgi:hypothetical protein